MFLVKTNLLLSMYYRRVEETSVLRLDKKVEEEIARDLVQAGFHAYLSKLKIIKCFSQRQME